jgi:hypothetical protein
VVAQLINTGEKLKFKDLWIAGMIKKVEDIEVDLGQSLCNCQSTGSFMSGQTLTFLHSLTQKKL